MSKNLNKPEHYAENGSLIQDQWYQHSITCSATTVGETSGPVIIYLYNKSSSKITTLNDLYIQASKYPWAGHGQGTNGFTSMPSAVLGFNQVNANGTTTIYAIIGTTTGNALEAVMIALNTVSDTVTPY